MRSERPSGAAESENGWASHQRPREEPPEEELSRPSVQPVEMPAGDAQRDHAGAFENHLIHAQAIPEPLNDGQREPKQYEHCQGSQVERGPVGRGAGIGDELIAGGYLMEPGEHDPGVGHKVDQVPRLVAQTTPHDEQRCEHHQHQQPCPHRGRDHAGIAAQQLRGLGWDREAVG